MKNRRIARIAVCLSLLLGLSACGKTDAKSPEDDGYSGLIPLEPREE